MSDFSVGPVSAPDTYQLVSLLGGGGEGEVWKAILPLSAEGRRTVAIKITRARNGDDGRWQRFGHLLRSLSHPGLVRVTDAFAGPPMHRHGEAVEQVDHLPQYVVMDYIDGTNLREWPTENPDTTAAERLRLLGMIAAALDEMHSGANTEVAVAHGDVKPANIVVRSDGAAILVDLGLARLADAAGVAGRSAAYAAPELRAPGSAATPEADRYAFAVTTAHLLTGQAPPVGADGWLDPDALREQLATSPLTAGRPLLVQRIMAMINAPSRARTTGLRPWLDGAAESLSQPTGNALAACPAAPSSDDVDEHDDARGGPDGSAAESTGEHFGPYRLEELIGRGGMGEVYRATDTSRGRVVALKRLPPRLADDPAFQARFRAESALAARLNEPHIIPIHDFGEIDGQLYIDMRLVEGTDLAHLLADTGPLAPARAVDIVRQVASALDAAHAAALVHRDVKPANVLLRTDGTGSDGTDFAYLVDFGIARAVDSTGLTATGAAIGSVSYMAPERFDGDSDHRSDIYSLGCLLYEALTARRPFPVADSAGAIHAHLFLDPPRASVANPAVPPALDAVIATAMAKSPDDRYASAGALAAAARQALALAEGVTIPNAANPRGTRVPTAAPGWYDQGPGVPTRSAVAPRPVKAPSTPPMRWRRLRFLAAAAVAVVLLTGTGVGGYLSLASGKAEPGGPVALSPIPTVRQDPIQTPGENPFMPSAGEDVPDVVQPPESRGAYSGSTPGLYGGTLNNADCDRPSMISFLQTNPDKAAAWAAVQDITPDAIPRYINQLTPVILRGDTAVTNHGFARGAATTLQAVLQAGTAVLVDAFGVPRARCSCGNPLTPPEQPTNARLAEPAWPRFNPSSMLSVTPNPVPLAELTLKDLTDNSVIFRPIGTAGERDRKAVEPTPVTPAPRPRPEPPPAPVVPTSCQAGFQLVDGKCVKKPPECADDQILEGGQCKNRTPRCPDGSRPIDGGCPVSPPPPCAPPNELIGGECQPANPPPVVPPCPAGYYREGDGCYPLPE